jgi:hypothetical protein
MTVRASREARGVPNFWARPCARQEYFNVDFCDLAARGKVRLVAYDLATGLGIAQQLPAVAVGAAIEVVRVDGHAFQPSKLAAEF